jgi:membrane protein implicated in regulation of membrane protease activity
VPDRAEITRIVADCVRYWRETRVPRRAIEDMRLELEQHLIEADGEGRSPERVVGTDLAEFAESWASEYRAKPGVGSWQDVTSGRAASTRRERVATWTYVVGTMSLIAGVIAGTQISGGGSQVDSELWRWVWTVVAVVFAIAEIFTAGFFLLPVAIGAVGAAILAWAGVDPVPQWLVFFGVSAIAFTYLQRFSRHQDDHQPKVGANRWAGARGIVLSDIDPDHSTGMVRVEGEEWRGTSDEGRIPAGTRIAVVEVRGSRLVVTPVDEV